MWWSDKTQYVFQIAIKMNLWPLWLNVYDHFYSSSYKKLISALKKLRIFSFADQRIWLMRSDSTEAQL